jgi:hypothetical protein
MKFQANSAKFTMNVNNSISGKSPTIFFSFWLFDIKNAVIFPFLKTWEEKEIDVGETFHYNRPDSAQLKHRWAGKRKSIEHVNYFEKLRGCVLVFADLVTPRSKHPNHIRTIFLDQNVKY